ncbi:MAG: sel1 repeat family protein, partial [Oxalobacter sp.]|nr:sel1 repeat family protein [Oxalobacter sp.]
MFTASRVLLCVTLFSLTVPVVAQQMPILSKACPVGTKEAQALFQTGMLIRSGKGSEKKNPQLAEEYFEMAIVKGSAQAAIALGDMYRYDFAKKHPKAVREKQSKAMYTLATELGCPDASAFLAEYHNKEMGVKKDPEKALELAKQAADADSPKGMEVYGRLIAEYKKDVDSGRIWLKRAIEMGNG